MAESTFLWSAKIERYGTVAEPTTLGLGGDHWAGKHSVPSTQFARAVIALSCSYSDAIAQYGTEHSLCHDPVKKLIML
jgi:hypothetical protein